MIWAGTVTLDQPNFRSRTTLAVWCIAAASATVHLALASRYDIFRNELYFIVCGRHPDFGFVDQPPLVPLLAAATQLFGDNIWTLRLPAVIAAAALPLVTAGLARCWAAMGFPRCSQQPQPR